jgi:hypothetical protein
LRIKLYIIPLSEVPNGIGILAACLYDEGFGLGDKGCRRYSRKGLHSEVRPLWDFGNELIPSPSSRLKPKSIYHLYRIKRLIRHFENCLWCAHPERLSI